MSTNFRSLTANARTLGEIFYSGSMEVKKGQEVIFTLSEWFSFRVTEDCKVSMNASPFVNVAEGDSFIIYKRSQSDIDDGNRKGVYIFDRDTILSLAYPQQLTQDIIIENDIFNNNYNSVIVEADKTPIAVINVDNQEPIVGQTIQISSGSYAVAPATIVSHYWTINGAYASGGASFAYKTATVGTLDITLVVTDSDGRKGNTKHNVRVEALPPPVEPPVTTPPPTEPNPEDPPKAISTNVGIRLSDKPVSTTAQTHAEASVGIDMYDAKINLSGSFVGSSAVNSSDWEFNPKVYVVDIYINGINYHTITGTYPNIKYWDTFTFDGYHTFTIPYLARGSIVDVKVRGLNNANANSYYQGAIKSGSVDLTIYGYDKPL